ncbi:class I SAM-dependent methyltransferase [Methyloversatilis discipulorum]|uniref:class I SAM-dependent methyltransferase n=1 Tax=Methyloversatilis discipulorum TaxID=1119528 RepID=UPI000366C7A9|nr:class I SAM-dependent methyltransferase [Methyloversatilis discipulorum]
MSNSPCVPDIDLDLAGRLDTAWGDPADWVAHGLHWTHLPAVKARLHRQVTGDASIEPLEWFFGVVGAHQPLPLRRVLFLGCGQGRDERLVARSGWADEIVAIDLSAKALDLARDQAKAAGARIHYVQADMNNLPVGQSGFEPGSFDAVLGISSVHHCANLEGLYASVAQLLAPAGWLFLNEYVGPDRFQCADSQLRFMNQLVDMLPHHLRTTRDGQLKGNLWRPSVDEVVAVDPTEAVRSSEVLPLLDRHFDVVEHRPYGGTLMRVVLAGIAQNFMNAEAEPWLHALLRAEDDLFRSGRVHWDLACVIARARSAATAPPNPYR